MPNTAEATQHAVSDAARRGSENARATIEVSRALVDEAAQVNRKLYAAWASGAEGSLKAAFDLQNAALAASLPLVDAAAGANRRALEQWADAIRQAQPAVIDGFRAGAHAAERLVVDVARNGAAR